MIITRLMLLLQLITVFPLIMYILRSQLFMLLLKKENVQQGGTYKKIYLLNAVVLLVAILFAVLMPTIGNIIRYVGGLCGAVVVFVLPSLTALVSAKKEGKLNEEYHCKVTKDCPTGWSLKLNFFKVMIVLLHVGIILLGITNFIAQFFI